MPRRPILIAATLFCLGLAAPQVRADPIRPGWHVPDPSRFSTDYPPRVASNHRAAVGNQWVVIDLGDDGPLAFDAYRIPPAAIDAGNYHNGVVMGEIKASTWFRARLTAEQREILDNSWVQTTPDETLGAMAHTDGSNYLISVTSGFSFFISNYSGAIARHQNNNAGYLEEISLLLMSEYDFIKGRPRWFWPPLYRWYTTARPPALQGAPDPAAESMIIRGMTRVLLLHELCHHFAGDTTPTAMMALGALYEQGRMDEFRAISHARELAADRCAAEHVSASGADPRMDMLFLLVITTLQYADGTLSHPTGPARIDQIRELGDRALDAAEAAGEDPILIANQRAGFATIAAWSADTRPLDEVQATFRRGVWPACPFAPAAGPVCQ